jgi:cell division septal protein FtsQ
MNRKYSSNKLLEKRKKQRKIKRIIFSFLFLILLGGGIWFFNSENLRIKEIVISGHKYSEKEEIISIAQNILNQNYFFILNKSNLFFYPRNQIITEIKNQNVIIREIKTEIVDWDNLNIEIVEHDPVAFYCISTSDCYLININGLVFDKELIIPENLVQVAGLLNEGENLIGQYYSDYHVLNRIVYFFKILKENNFKPLKISSEDNETFSIYLENGPILLIEENLDSEKVITNLKTVIEKDGINQIQFANLEYMDLRFGNKVYYKIK